MELALVNSYSICKFHQSKIACRVLYYRCFVSPYSHYLGQPMQMPLVAQFQQQVLEIQIGDRLRVSSPLYSQLVSLLPWSCVLCTMDLLECLRSLHHSSKSFFNWFKLIFAFLLIFTGSGFVAITQLVHC